MLYFTEAGHGNAHPKLFLCFSVGCFTSPFPCFTVQIQRFSLHVETTPPQYFSLLCTTIALPSTLCRNVTSLRIAYASQCFADAILSITLPLHFSASRCRCFSRRCCTNTQRLSTMTVLVSSPPRQRYDVHHRNVTALCNAVTRLRHALPLRHRALPSYATPFHVRTIPSQCFTVFSLTNTELRDALPYHAVTIRNLTITLPFCAQLHHGGTMLFTALPLPRPALPNTALTLPFIARPLHNWF